MKAKTVGMVIGIIAVVALVIYFVRKRQQEAPEVATADTVAPQGNWFERNIVQPIQKNIVEPIQTFISPEGKEIGIQRAGDVSGSTQGSVSQALEGAMASAAAGKATYTPSAQLEADIEMGQEFVSPYHDQLRQAALETTIQTAEFTQKRAFLRSTWGEDYALGENDINYAHKVAVNIFNQTGADIKETEAEVLTSMGYRMETPEEHITRRAEAEYELALKQGIDKSRYGGDKEALWDSIYEQFASGYTWRIEQVRDPDTGLVIETKRVPLEIPESAYKWVYDPTQSGASQVLQEEELMEEEVAQKRATDYIPPRTGTTAPSKATKTPITPVTIKPADPTKDAVSETQRIMREMSAAGYGF